MENLETRAVAEANNPPKKWAVERAWSSTLAETGHVPVVNAFLEHYSSLKPALTTGEAMFVIFLMKHKWDEAAPFPSYQRIARMMGVSHKMARRYAANLEKKGYLERERYPSLSNRFHLSKLFGALEGVVAETRRNRRQPEPSKHRGNDHPRAQFWHGGRPVPLKGLYSCKLCGELKALNAGDVLPPRCADLPTAWFGPKP